jgi:hypothetical protein
MQEHMRELETDPDYKALYTLISNSIIKRK